jgi:hypothetical protein
MNRTWVVSVCLVTAVLLVRPPNPALAVSDSPPLGPFLDISTDSLDNLSPAIAYNSLHGEYLVVWTTVQGSTWHISARRVGVDGSLRSSFDVDTIAAVRLWEPAVAYSPAHDEYLIVYTGEVAEENYDIFARRIKWDGTGAAARTSLATGPDIQQHPSVAYNRQNDQYLVVYEEETAAPATRVLGRLLKASDGTLQSGGVPIAAGVGQYRRQPDVAYNPDRNNYLVVYSYEEPASSGCSIPARIASADLLVLSREFRVGANPGCGYEPAVATGPGEYLVVWSTSDQVYGRRVGAEGMPRGPSGGFALPSTAPAPNRRNPDVAYRAGFGYLATWWQFQESSEEGDVYGRFVLPGGDQAAGSEFLMDGSVQYQGRPSVACAPGGNCLVAEEHIPTTDPGDLEIRGRLVGLWRSHLPLVLR